MSIETFLALLLVPILWGWLAGIVSVAILALPLLLIGLGPVEVLARESYRKG